jgi:hypothetical protein
VEPQDIKAWIGVASRDHVQRGLIEGFAQFCHGKHVPASRPRRGDWIFYYSSQEILGGQRCQRFTACGVVDDDAPVQVVQAPGFEPWRRQIRWLPVQETPIQPLLSRLSFVRDKTRWGAPFRFGFLEIPLEDAVRIAEAMELAVHW